MNNLITIVSVLIAVAFFTLMERKFMALSHARLGPNKVGPTGLLQPFSDALKLLSKENNKISKLNFMLYSMAPCLVLLIYTTIWSTFPSTASKCNNKLSLLTFITIMSASIFFLTASGWGSNSKYSILGAYRSVAQMISYEILLLLLVLPPLFCLNLMDMEKSTLFMTTPFFLLALPLLLVWALTLMAETNRTPFDLSESESELVSGFNTEYSSGPFAMIFIAEYSALIIMSLLTYTLMLQMGTPLASSFNIVVMFFFIWTRVSMPRMRYDFLMLAMWKNFMGPSIFLFVLGLILYNIMFFSETF